MVSEFGFLSIEVIKMQKEDYVQDARHADMKTSTKVFEKKKSETALNDKLESS